MPQPDSNSPYAGMTDEQVLARATNALRLVQHVPVGSVERAMQWAVYEDAKAEMDVRLYSHVLRKIREHGQP